MEVAYILESFILNSLSWYLYLETPQVLANEIINYINLRINNEEKSNISDTLITEFNELFNYIHHDYNIYKLYDSFTWTVVGLMYLIELYKLDAEYANICKIIKSLIINEEENEKLGSCFDLVDRICSENINNNESENYLINSNIMINNEIKEEIKNINCNEYTDLKYNINEEYKNIIANSNINNNEGSELNRQVKRIEKINLKEFNENNKLSAQKSCEKDSKFLENASNIFIQTPVPLTNTFNNLKKDDYICTALNFDHQNQINITSTLPIVSTSTNNTISCNNNLAKYNEKNNNIKNNNENNCCNKISQFVANINNSHSNNKPLSSSFYLYDTPDKHTAKSKNTINFLINQNNSVLADECPVNKSKDIINNNYNARAVNSNSKSSFNLYTNNKNILTSQSNYNDINFVSNRTNKKFESCCNVNNMSYMNIIEHNSKQDNNKTIFNSVINNNNNFDNLNINNNNNYNYNFESDSFENSIDNSSLKRKCLLNNFSKELDYKNNKISDFNNTSNNNKKYFINTISNNNNNKHKNTTEESGFKSQRSSFSKSESFNRRKIESKTCKPSSSILTILKKNLNNKKNANKLKKLQPVSRKKNTFDNNKQLNNIDISKTNIMLNSKSNNIQITSHNIDKNKTVLSNKKLSINKSSNNFVTPLTKRRALKKIKYKTLVIKKKNFNSLNNNNKINIVCGGTSNSISTFNFEGCNITANNIAFKN